MDNSDCRHEMPTHTLIHRNTGALDHFTGLLDQPYTFRNNKSSPLLLSTLILQRYFRRGYHIAISYFATSTKVSKSSLVP